MNAELTEQRTKAWLDCRAGHVTASRIGDVMTQPRKGQKESSTRKSYMAQIICERLAGQSLEEERGSNFYDVQRGIRLESTIRSEYDLRNNAAVQTAGFVKHPAMEWAGCSPDGITATGLIQIKAPRRWVQLEWVEQGIVPTQHRDQMLFELACTKREYNDFVSYIDDPVPDLQYFQVRLYPDHARIKEIEEAVAKFNAEVAEKIAKLSFKRKSLEEQLKESLAAVQNANPKIELVP